jgi:hypothetical protein
MHFRTIVQVCSNLNLRRPAAGLPPQVRVTNTQLLSPLRNEEQLGEVTSQDLSVMQEAAMPSNVCVPSWDVKEIFKEEEENPRPRIVMRVPPRIVATLGVIDVIEHCGIFGFDPSSCQFYWLSQASQLWKRVPPGLTI